MQTVGTYHLDLIPIPRSIEEFLLFWQDVNIEKRLKFIRTYSFRKSLKLLGFQLNNDNGYYVLETENDWLFTIKILNCDFVFVAECLISAKYYTDLISIPETMDDFLVFWRTVQRLKGT